MKKTVILFCLFFSLAWPLGAQEAVVLGGTGGEGELIYPRKAKTGPEGDIYVYDQADAFIKIYSSRGEYLRRIGGKGQGPGEIQRAEGVSFGFTTDGKLFFTEFFGGHPWITLLETDGALIRVIKPSFKEYFGIYRALSLPGNRFLLDIGFLGKPEKKDDYFYHRSPREIVLIDGEGAVLSRVLRTDPITRISFRDRGADSPIPFTPAFAWCLYGEDAVLYSNGLDTAFCIFDFKGNLLKKIPTPLPEPEKVTKKDLAEWRARRKEMMSGRDPDWWNRFGRVIEKYKKSIYSHKPNLYDLQRTPRGRILVAGRRERADSPARLWLLDKEGKQLAALNTKAWVMEVSSRFILYGEVGADGIPIVKALERRGSETEDLLRLED